MAGSGPADDRTREPQALGEVLRGVLRSGPMRSGAALGLLARSWEAVVGERLAGTTAPLRLEHGRLLVSAESAAWAAQVTFLAAEIQARGNVILGSEEVHSVRVVVGRNEVKGT